jgi:hypothetical protein
VLLLLILLVTTASAASAAPAVLVTDGTATPIGILSGLSDPTVDPQDRVAFLGTSTAAFQATRAGVARLVAAGDTLALGTTLANVVGVGPPVLGAAGCVASVIAYRGGSSVVRQCGDDTIAVAITGDVGPDGHRMLGFDPQLVANTGGEVAFLTRTDDGSTVAIASTSAGLVEVARVGGPSPRGGTLATLRLIGLSQRGAVGLRATVDDGPDGFFFFDQGQLHPLVVVNDPSPAGGLVTQLGEATMSAANHWAFRARSSGGDVNAIFRADVVDGRPLLVVVAREGDSSPIGGHYRQFPRSIAPSINAHDAIAFRATLSDTLFGAAIFVVDPQGNARRVVAAAEPTALGQFVQLRTAQLADDGGVVVGASLAGGGGGFFAFDADGVRPVAQIGSPTDVGGTFRFVGASVREDTETVAVAGQREGIFTLRAGGRPVVVAALGDPAPGGGTIAGLDPPTIGAGGRVVFRADVRDGGASEGLFEGRGRRVRSLVRAGARSPDGGVFIEFQDGSLGPVVRPDVVGSAIAFEGRLKGDGSSSGLFVARGRRVRAVARAGERAPGGGTYAVFGTPVMAPGGAVGFVARLDGTSAGEGLFLRRGRHTTVAARTGEDAGLRIPGRLAEFGQPDLGTPGLVWQARLQTGREVLVLRRGRRQDTLTVTGDAAPGGGTLTHLGAPTFAGRSVVFVAALAGQRASGGVFRLPLGPGSPGGGAEALALVGQPTTAGGTFLAFGPPSGNVRGTAAATVRMSGGSATTAIVTLTR